ncbi:MAG: flavin reductase family protein [Clostridia bacterium]|nr:flavin reductase family protein [Clostridia bacterium]
MKQFRPIDPCTMLCPVPAVMISCRGITEEKPNIITVAWAGTVNTTPPMVSVSIRKERYSHHLIQESGEFVVNLVDAAHCRELDWCGVKSGRDFDKFAEMKLTAVPAAELQYAPAIAECPAYLSCRVKSVTELGSHDMFIGEVVAVRVQEELFREDGSMHLEKAGLVCYNHGVYQQAQDVLGFFGYSLARPEVLKKRMAQYDR